MDPTSELTSVYVSLNDMKSIVRHGFRVHRSISHLDLSLCEYSLFKGDMNKSARLKKHLNHVVSAKNNFICTEEGSKKDLAKKRRLLYTLHLDLGLNLESSQRLADNKKEFEYCYDGIILNGIATPSKMYERLLNDMINNALKIQEVKYIKGVVKVMKFVDLPGKSAHLLIRCLEILHSQCSDSTIVRELVTTIGLEESDLLFLKPHILEFFLRHTDCNDAEFRLRQEWINNCVFYCKFEQVATLLKFCNAPRFSESLYLKVQKSLQVGCGLNSWQIEMPVQQGWITKERNLLILQILDVYYSVFALFENSCLLSSGLEAMRRIWRSVPDVFITLEELELFYGQTRIRKELKRIHDFYTDIVQDKALSQPRPLQDYCRITIRKALTEGQRLHGGVGQLDMPPPLQKFLKLEK